MGKLRDGCAGLGLVASSSVGSGDGLDQLAISSKPRTTPSTSTIAFAEPLKQQPPAPPTPALSIGDPQEPSGPSLLACSQACVTRPPPLPGPRRPSSPSRESLSLRLGSLRETDPDISRAASPECVILLHRKQARRRPRF